MSIICINGKFENENSNLLLLNRGFLYADGLFETMIHDGEKVRNFRDHMERLGLGMKFFDYEIPPLFFKDVEDHIKLTLEKNMLSGISRVKLVVWRNMGGLYTPTQKSFSFLIICSQAIENNDKNLKIGVYKKPLLPHTNIGNFKTLNSIYYVHAGIEKKKSGLDDLILLNTSSQICECTSANIFWKKDDIFYTPSLETGCIAGIKRKQFIKELRKKSTKVVEGTFVTSDLEGVAHFYLTNITGIRESTELII